MEMVELFISRLNISLHSEAETTAPLTGAVAKPSGKKAKRAKTAGDGEGRVKGGADKGEHGLSGGKQGVVKADPGHRAFHPGGSHGGVAKKGGKEWRTQSEAGGREKKKRKRSKNTKDP